MRHPKTFKQYDKQFANLSGTALKTIERVGGKIAREDIDACTEWPDIFKEHFTEDYAAHQIAYAVYEAPGAEEWQAFRVSLKGLSTRQKLYALMWRWANFIEPFSDPKVRHLEMIRINNYLGALKRGGLLDGNLKLIRG